MIDNNVIIPTTTIENDVQELIELIGKLDSKQKKDVLNILRGFTLAADCESERGEARHDNS